MNDDEDEIDVFFRHLNDVLLLNVIAAARNEAVTRINDPLDHDEEKKWIVS